MDHVAIMRKSWDLTSKIISGEKTIETRWYKNKSAPWDKIHPGDTVYFKDSGCPVTVKAEVLKVEQFADLNEGKIVQILSKYSQHDLGTGDIPNQIKEYTSGKKYCIIIHLKNSRRVNPAFNISKKGFGAMAAWITLVDINDIII